MEARKSAKLPDGVGRKIIAALKKQNESTQEIYSENSPDFNDFMNLSQDDNKDFTAYSDNESAEPLQNIEEESKFNDFNLDNEIDDFTEQFEEPEKSIINKNSEVYSDFDEYELRKETVSRQTKQVNEPMTEERRPILTRRENEYEKYVPEYNSRKYSKPELHEKNKVQKISNFKQYNDEDNFEENESVELNSDTNVNILKRLISKLPAGVTRQTGAQIIRQTMEAMGISMSKVLTEAQQTQNDLTQSIRDNINTIEEYRNNIRALEKEVQNYKNQSEELEDLIGLFVISDKNPKFKNEK